MHAEIYRNYNNLLTDFLFFEESTIPEAHASFTGSAFVSKGCLAATTINNGNRTLSDTKEIRTRRHQ